MGGSSGRCGDRRSGASDRLNTGAGRLPGTGAAGKDAYRRRIMESFDRAAVSATSGENRLVHQPWTPRRERHHPDWTRFPVRIAD